MKSSTSNKFAFKLKTMKPKLREIALFREFVNSSSLLFIFTGSKSMKYLWLPRIVAHVHDFVYDILPYV